ncbi:metallophosphoesterase [Tenggerimyces flavus]|uniref:Metallophosphoesterase n=1 Tax=Tenggerimyces flavus TaxID=1708749 RepID=A0ABV7YBH2_9ACTN|nr:metallophosphoesterase [Tenggerimyces flavus]MBM7783506.1 putative MPP superfamily phosphohydrolase [Tenggerimyces flavus]
MHRTLNVALKAALGTAALGAACFAYAAAYEARAYRLRRFDLPVLKPGSRPIRVLHLSDLHLTPDLRAEVDWVRGLAALEPDLVVNTGDNLSHPDAVETVVEALEPLLERPGVFVFGSNDYFAPTRRNPLRYFWSRGGPKHLTAPRLPTEDLRKQFAGAGWLDLSNALGSLTIGGQAIAFAGVDDPHIRWDRYDLVAGPADPTADLTVGVLHAPYQRVLDPMANDGYQLLLAGHTHGGQVCLPGYGALVSNCDLPTRQAKGVSRWRESWLHVSAGLGTSPYSRFRFACYPEASLLTLRPAPADTHVRSARTAR